MPEKPLSAKQLRATVRTLESRQSRQVQVLADITAQLDAARKTLAELGGVAVTANGKELAPA